MRRALVTGATGFLGGNLARRLHSEGWEVTAAGRNVEAGGNLAEAGIDFKAGDLGDVDYVRELCRGQHTIFHCAALSSPWGSREAFQRSNVLATRNIAEVAMKEKAGRLVHVSTPSVYFDYRNRLNIEECEPLPARPANLYAATKREAERIVAAAALEGLETVTLRPRAIFGPGDTTLFPRLIRANDEGGIPLFRGGSALLDLTYIDNAVDALILAADAPREACNLCYNVSNGEPVRLLDALKLLFSALEYPLHVRKLPYPLVYALAGLAEARATASRSKREPRITRYSVGVLAKDQTLSLRNIQDNLGYKPRVSIEEGVSRFASWWRSRC